MKTIEFNGKAIDITAAEERVLRILKNRGFAAHKSDFEEGPRKYRRYILPSSRAGEVKLGIDLVTRDTAKLAREKAFFEANPRCHWCVTGSPRRINAMLRKLDAA